MNVRIGDKNSTPEERLAAVAGFLMLRIQKEFAVKGVGPQEPDFADFRDTLRPYVHQELIFARIDERRKMCGDMTSKRMETLQHELEEIQRQIPEEHWL